MGAWVLNVMHKNQGSGSIQFNRIRIRRNFYYMDPAPVAKATQGNHGKIYFFLSKLSFINLQT